jgi:hypothetical protein
MAAHSISGRLVRRLKGAGLKLARLEQANARLDLKRSAKNRAILSVGTSRPCRHCHAGRRFRARLSVACAASPMSLIQPAAGSRYFSPSGRLAERSEIGKLFRNGTERGRRIFSTGRRLAAHMGGGPARLRGFPHHSRRSRALGGTRRKVPRFRRWCNRRIRRSPARPPVFHPDCPAGGRCLTRHHDALREPSDRVGMPPRVALFVAESCGPERGRRPLAHRLPGGRCFARNLRLQTVSSNS